MTIEQKIRNFATTYEELFTNKHVYLPVTVKVLEDKDGVLKVEVTNSVSGTTSIKYLNGDKYHDTYEEAFRAELWKL